MDLTAAHEYQANFGYSVLMGKLRQAGIDLNRKVLADLAMNDPAAFAAIVNQVK